jgi:deazaflavin-dependent oxidoreductase (nitroreductase family)
MAGRYVGRGSWDAAVRHRGRWDELEAGVGRRQDERLRAMYVGGRGNATARRYVRFWNRIMYLGLLPPRWVCLEVVGRKSGRITRFPLGMADVDRRWYLVSMLGEANWVLNVRAAGGRAVLRRRRPREVTLLEVPVDERAPILKRYVEKVPGGRPHIPVDRHLPVEAFTPIAARYPVFQVLPG